MRTAFSRLYASPWTPDEISVDLSKAAVLTLPVVSAREAQTTVIFGSDVFVGVWPWGELWRYNADSRTWTFMRRLFDHPPLSDQIVRPYDVENSGRR